MNYKRLKILNGLILIALLIVNIRIYLNRDNGYAYTEILNYNQLYTVAENLQISRFTYNGIDSITLYLNKNEANTAWEITIDSTNSFTNKGNPQFQLIEGKHKYHLKNKKDTTVSILLGLNFVTEKTYEKSGRKRNSDVELLYSSLAFENTAVQSKEFWKQTSALTTEQEIKNVSSILRNEVKLQHKDSTIQKIKKISAYILSKLQYKHGTPADTMDKLSPQQKFDFALRNRSKVWCGDFADIFALYANTAGITTRLVCTEGDANGILKSGHSFNECYVPEIQQWVFIDLTSATLLVQNSQGIYLNAIDFYNAHLLQSSDLTVTKFENDSLFQTPYRTEKSFYNDYFNKGTYFVFYNASQFSKEIYSFKNKWLRYVTKRPTFAVYSNSAITDNKLFYQKQTLMTSLVVFLFYLSLLFVVNHLSKKP